jgi:hypothetical protein
MKRMMRMFWQMNGITTGIQNLCIYEVDLLMREFWTTWKLCQAICSASAEQRSLTGEDGWQVLLSYIDLMEQYTAERHFDDYWSSLGEGDREGESEDSDGDMAEVAQQVASGGHDSSSEAEDADGEPEGGDGDLADDWSRDFVVETRRLGGDSVILMNSCSLFMLRWMWRFRTDSRR